MTEEPQDPPVKMTRRKDGTKGPRLDDIVKLHGNPRKSAALAAPGTIKPRNQVEARFLDLYGTVTPIPTDTHRRDQKHITAAILYIHHNKSAGECAEIVGCCVGLVCRIRTEDKWDQFKQQLMQAAKPSCLALVEHHDIERINQERERRNNTIDDLVASEEKIITALPNMPPGSLVQATALGNLAAIRKLIAQTIGLDTHIVEQSAGRKAGIVGAINKFISPDATPPGEDKGSILDV